MCLLMRIQLQFNHGSSQKGKIYQHIKTVNHSASVFSSRIFIKSCLNMKYLICVCTQSTPLFYGIFKGRMKRNVDTSFYGEIKFLLIRNFQMENVLKYAEIATIDKYTFWSFGSSNRWMGNMSKHHSIVE